MKSTTKSKRTAGRKIWIPILVVLLIAGGGFGYWYYSSQKAAKTAVAAASTSFNTTQVKKGSITISVSGSGTLIAGSSSDMKFSTDGTVDSVKVQVGDQVKKGDVLAQLANLDQLQASVTSAQQDLISAQQALATLKQSASSNLANAQIAVANAQEAVSTAQSSVVQKDWTRCDQTTVDAYYYKYTHAQTVLASLGDGGGNSDYYLKVILPQKNIVAQAKAAYDSCSGYTAYEVSASQATLALDQAQLKQAQTTLDTLTKNNGNDPIALATAENQVTTAQLALDKAQATLDGATLKAPFNGTILTVAGNAGDSVAKTDTFITIADLTHPQIQFSIDETDMDKVAVGESTTVVFDALPDSTFKGKVTRINPALESSGGYNVVTGMIQMDLSAETTKTTLPQGLTATVQIVQASAENVLLVPTQALHDLGDGTYSVFVVGSDGQPKLKVVEVGLQDAASTEIKSGLSLGDVVTTGTVQTK